MFRVTAFGKGRFSSWTLGRPGEVGAEKAALYGAGHVGLQPLFPPKGGASWWTGARGDPLEQALHSPGVCERSPIPGRQKSNRSWRAGQELELYEFAGLLGPRDSRWRKRRGAATPVVHVDFGYI